MNFEWLAGLPTWWGTVAHTACWVALGCWAWTLPREATCPEGAARARWCDLRLWIVPLALVQIALYWWL